MIIHSNKIFVPIYVQTDRIVVLAQANMVLNVNIKLFFVENYIIQVELYVLEYVFKKCVHLFKRNQIIVS